MNDLIMFLESRLEALDKLSELQPTNEYVIAEGAVCALQLIIIKNKMKVVANAK